MIMLDCNNIYATGDLLITSLLGCCFYYSANVFIVFEGGHLSCKGKDDRLRELAQKAGNAKLPPMFMSGKRSSKSVKTVNSKRHKPL